MEQTATSYEQQQEKVNAYFTSQSSFWKEIYARKDVYAQIHQDRHVAILDWITSLALVPAARVLEIGCGAGFLSVALAQCGFQVCSIDSSAAMVEQARANATAAGVADAISLAVGDVYSLAFNMASFDLVVAVGVIPWLAQPELAMQEMARVLKPDGYLILTADNRARLNIHLDPSLYPGFLPLKRFAKNALDRTGIRRRSADEVDSHFHTQRAIDGILSRLNLVKANSKTLGFGPFTLFRCPLLPKAAGIALHYRLQGLADRNVPVLRTTGSHYIVLARKLAVSAPVAAVRVVSEAEEASLEENVRI